VIIHKRNEPNLVRDQLTNYNFFRSYFVLVTLKNSLFEYGSFLLIFLKIL